MFILQWGHEAFQYISNVSFNFDLLITDFDMPIMNGKQLIEKLLESKISVKKTIVLSGLSENEELLTDILSENKNIIFIHKLTSTEDLLHQIFH